MDLTRQNNRLKVNMRNNINSIGCNNSHANLDIPSI